MRDSTLEQLYLLFLFLLPYIYLPVGSEMHERMHCDDDVAYTSLCLAIPKPML